jgi:hypothetical protein
MKTKTIVLSCLLSIMPTISSAWNAMGHMLVAQVAYENLTPHTKKQVDQLTAIIGQDYPKVNNFVAGAPWADDIKSETSEFSTWHYINIGFSDDGTTVPDAPEPNVLTGIDTTITVIKDPSASKEEKGEALLMLAHLVGDLHQPMHAATQFSRSNPLGDAGGNKFTLKGPYKNLHALWDASAGRYGKNPSRPLGSSSKEMLHEEAQELVDSYLLANDPRLELTTPTQWVQESYQVSRDYAYDGIRKNDYPSDDYKERAGDVSGDQITIAGIRLANLLNSLFDNQ